MKQNFLLVLVDLALGQHCLLMGRWRAMCLFGMMGLVAYGFLSMPICPFTEVHPLLGVKGDGKSKKKQAGRPKGSKGKEKDSPFKPKLYKGDRGLPLEGSAKGKVQAELSQPLTGKDTLGALSGLLRGLALFSPDSV